MKLNKNEKAAFKKSIQGKGLQSRNIQIKDLKSGIADLVKSKKTREAISSAKGFGKKINRDTFESDIKELVKKHGCSIKPADPSKDADVVDADVVDAKFVDAVVVDADVVVVGKTGVKVRPVTGNLSDVTGRNYSGKDAKNKVGIVENKIGEDFLGAEDMGSGYPVILFMKPPTGKPKALLRYAVGRIDETVCTEIAQNKDKGYEIESVIVGTHVARNPASKFTALTTHHFCEQLNIPFGIFNYEDKGKGTFWIDIDVPNKQIQVGTDNHSGGRENSDQSAQL